MEEQDNADRQLHRELDELHRKNSELESQYRHAEATLRASEQKFITMMNAMLQGVCVIQDSVFEFVNSSLATFLDFSEDELIGKTFTKFIYPEDREMVSQLYSEEISGRKEKMYFTFRAVDKSGRVKWLDGDMRLISWEGKPAICISATDISNRKQAEDALKDSEKRYRELVEKANDIIYLTDANGYFKLFNSVGMKITGYTQEEIVTKHYLDLIHPDYKKQVERFYGIQFAKRTADTYYELPIIARNGETIWIGQNVQLVMDNGTVAGFQAICRDITARKLAEKALIESERTLKSLLTASPIGIMFSRKGQIRWANDAWTTMFGFENEQEYIGQSTSILYPSKQQYDYVQNTLYGNLKSGKVPEIDTAMVRKDGSSIHVHIRINYLDPDNPARGTISAIADVSDRKRAEEALRQSEQRLELCLHGADLGLWDWDLTTAQPTWNDRAAEMLGYSLDEVKHDFETWKSLIHPEDWPNVSRVIRGHLEGRLPILESECRFRSKTGEWRWILSQGRIVAHDADGKPLRMAGTSLDVTERKMAEFEKESLRAQLAQSKKMEAIGTLTGGIAHEFNNLLTVVTGYAELLLSEMNTDDPARSDLQKIVEAARRGAGLVRSLLIFSQKTDVCLNPINLNAEVNEVKKLLDRTLPRMIEIELNLSSELKNIRADPGQIRQLLMNLALNARDAMPAGGKFAIETENTTYNQCIAASAVAPGDYVQLTISDTGIGMDRDTLNRIFEPFYTTKGLACGTGLGLSIVHGILEQHGGHISCTSEPGEGSIFKVLFPVVEEIPDCEIVLEVAQVVGTTEIILIVDDEEQLRELAARILKRAGFRVVAAQNCEEALEIYQKDKSSISLIILDLMMPKLGGKECLEKLLEIHPEVKVLIASGHSDSEQTEELLQAGAKGFVAKPFLMADFLKTVREILKS